MFIGGLLPKGTHTFTATQFVTTFCFNPTRKEMYNQGLRVLAGFLNQNNVSTLIVDGSYVEEMDWPKDIDCFFEVTVREFISIFGKSFTPWQRHMINDCKCDVYPCFTDIKPYPAEGRDWACARDYWEDKFGHTRDGHEKGIVSVGTADIFAEVAP